MKINSSKPLIFGDVKQILEKRKKEGEIGYEQERVLEYLKKYGENSKNDKELLKKIMDMGNMNEETAVLLVNIKPKKPETVKAILLKDRIDLSEEQIEEIVKMFQ